ncbi:hypothetical protein [Paenibacillus spongiae]|uniref:Uncharacterized protein n=1 Tax=Paenibacillus spongiae TaxID=2909671 RepID=A0ABY5SG37_9BACL|nr:hypothetical protein [Paenibacillus spongiae]UVI31228.1 hypothetical protein L1F29_05125 [Paenibacillus spongiae]
MQWRPNIPTPEEIIAIRDYVILPYMLDMVEVDRQKLESDSVSLRLLFEAANGKLADQIHKELVEVRKFLKERQIKVIEEGLFESEMRYKFWVRGYEDHFTLMREVARSELSTRFGKYIANFWK